VIRSSPRECTTRRGVPLCRYLSLALMAAVSNSCSLRPFLRPKPEEPGPIDSEPPKRHKTAHTSCRSSASGKSELPPLRNL
jgi:hypothetical protein